MNDNNEIWKLVPGVERPIEASSFGRIRYVDVQANGRKGLPGEPQTGSVCFTGPNKVHRRVQITLRRAVGGPKRSYILARLVCTAFHGPPPFPDAKCLHIDEDGLNNRPENLMWGTQKQNLNARAWAKHWQRRALL